MDLARLSLLIASFCVTFPALRHLYHDFKKSLLKSHRARNQLQFLRDCRDEMVIPDCCLPKHLRCLDDLPFSNVDRAVLDALIAKKQAEVNKCFKASSRARTILCNSVTRDWWFVICDFVYGLLRKQNVRHKASLKKKLHNLFEKSLWTQKSNPSLFENLSSYNMSRNEKLVLGYGINFSYTSDRNNIMSINKSFSKLEKFKNNNVSQENIQIARGLVYSNCLSGFKSSIPKCFATALKNLKRNKNIHITKADKSNALVILDSTAYNDKLNDLLNDRETYEPLVKDPTENTNKLFSVKLRSLLNDKPDLLKLFKSINPTLPYMYGLLKTHKPDLPLCSIIR